MAEVPVKWAFSCAVKGAVLQRDKARPESGSLHPVTIEAVAEVTKLLKPSM
jgi:hypothetical protein